MATIFSDTAQKRQQKTLRIAYSIYVLKEDKRIPEHWTGLSIDHNVRTKITSKNFLVKTITALTFTGS